MTAERMQAKIRLRRDSAKAEDVVRHFRACDGGFLTALEERISLDAYAQKLCEHAMRSEIWEGGDLVALLAVYANRIDTGTAFITNISVVSAWTGQGLGRLVMTDTLARIRELGFIRIDLEVAICSAAAIRFYLRHGFTEFERGSKMITFRREL